MWCEDVINNNIELSYFRTPVLSILEHKNVTNVVSIHISTLVSWLLGSFQPIAIICGVKPLYILGTRTDADSDMKPVSTDSVSYTHLTLPTTPYV